MQLRTNVSGVMTEMCFHFSFHGVLAALCVIMVWYNFGKYRPKGSTTGNPK
jgi:hypothetical protein